VGQEVDWSTAAPSRLDGIQHRTVPGHDPPLPGQADPFYASASGCSPTAWSRWPADHRLKALSPPVGGQGRKLPRRRRAGVPTRLRHPGPRPPGPRPGPQSLPMPGSLPLKGLYASWIGRECYAVDPEGQLRHLSRYRTDASRPGPRPRSYTNAASPRPRWPDCGRGVDGAPLDASRTRSATSPPAPEGTQGSCRPPSQLLSSSSGPRVSASCWSRAPRVICGISTVNGCVHRQLPVTVMHGQVWLVLWRLLRFWPVRCG
jgi:hypothetical protein